MNTKLRFLGIGIIMFFCIFPITKITSAENTDTKKISGTLKPYFNSCTIPSGKSDCSIYFTWNTINPVGISAITKNPNGMIVKEGNSGKNILFKVKYNKEIFYLYNNAELLAVSEVSSNCVYGSSWNGNKCVREDIVNSSSVETQTTFSKYTPNTQNSYSDSKYTPKIKITANVLHLLSGYSTYIIWSVYGPNNCTGVDGTNGWEGDKKTYGSFYTGALYENTKFTLTCSSNIDGSSATKSVTIYIKK